MAVFWWFNYISPPELDDPNPIPIHLSTLSEFRILLSYISPPWLGFKPYIATFLHPKRLPHPVRLHPPLRPGESGLISLHFSTQISRSKLYFDTFLHPELDLNLISLHFPHPNQPIQTLFRYIFPPWVGFKAYFATFLHPKNPMK